MRLGLGTVQFGMSYGVSNSTGKTEPEEVSKILRYAKEHDISYLDTASLYGDSERVLGSLSEADDFKIITKLPSIREKPEAGISFVEESLRLLGREQIDGLLLHDCQDLISGPKTVWETLEKCKMLGIVNKIGVSVYSPMEAEVIAKRFPIEIIQFPLNVLDQRFVESGITHTLKKKGVEIHTRSVFLQGLLLMSLQDQVHLFPEFSSVFSNLITKYEGVGVTPMDFALAYVNTIEEVDVTVVGVNNLEQLKGIVESLDKRVKNVSISDFTPLAMKNELLTNPTLWPKTGGRK